MVKEGFISSIDEIYNEGLKILEPEIVDILLSDLKEEVMDVNLVQKQTDAGEKSQFKAIVAVGNRSGYIGLGSGKSKQVRNAIEKAAMNARINVITVRRGCGSWECACGQLHSLPFKIQGKRGGVKVVLIPGPRGLGIVASESAKVFLSLSGIKDCWTKSFGSTKTASSFVYAIFDALKKTYHLVTPQDWEK
jgi:small subunit ribosomal protein S5